MKLTYNEAEVKRRAEPKIASAMNNGAEIIFDSPNDTRIFSLELSYHAVMEDEKVQSMIIERALAKKTIHDMLRLEAYKHLTSSIYEAENDWLFAEQHP